LPRDRGESLPEQLVSPPQKGDLPPSSLYGIVVENDGGFPGFWWTPPSALQPSDDHPEIQLVLSWVFFPLPQNMLSLPFRHGVSPVSLRILTCLEPPFWPVTPLFLFRTAKAGEAEVPFTVPPHSGSYSLVRRNAEQVGTPCSPCTIGTA